MKCIFTKMAAKLSLARVPGKYLTFTSFPIPFISHQSLPLSNFFSRISGSGSRSQRHGSGSFFHQAKIKRKTLIPSVCLLLFDFLFLKNDVNVPSKSIKQKNFFLNQFFVGLLKVNDENRWIRIRTRTRIHQSEAWICGSGSESGPGSISHRYGSTDPDPDAHQNVMDPQHWSGYIQY